MNTINSSKWEDNIQWETSDHTSNTAKNVASIQQNEITTESEWLREKDMYDNIWKVGINNHITANNIELKSAIYNPNNPEHHTSCLCMDERTINFGLNLAGSGILLADIIGFYQLVDLIKRINRKSEEKTGRKKIEKITSHESCGAAALYCKYKKLSWDTDDHGKEFSKKLAEALSLPYEHLELSTPHTARSIYVDFTGNFSEEPKSLPNGYNIAANKDFLDENPFIKDHITDQVWIAYSIAKLDKVHWDKINKDNPFFVFLVQNKWVEIDEYILSAIKELEWTNKGEIKIDYLTI